MKYLCKKGYCVPKNEIDSCTLRDIKRELRVTPIVDAKYAYNAPFYDAFFETQNNIYLPKMYGISKFGLPDTELANYAGERISQSTFNGTLYPHQEKPVQMLLEALWSIGGGILSLATGEGKTFCAINVISKLQGRTIVIVNKVSLLAQWKEEIEKFLPGASVGIIQGKTVDTETDISIAMIQSLSRAEYPVGTFDGFNTLIVDECHKISSAVFSKVMFKLCSKYTIGLTATPTRSDGCECVFKWHAGPVVFKSTGDTLGLPPIIDRHKLVSEKYTSSTDKNGNLQFSAMITSLVRMRERNEHIVATIHKVCAIPGRKLLVLSERRGHIETLYEMLKCKPAGFTFGKFMGGMKESDCTVSRACRVILATYSAFGEGVSEKDLDTLLLTTPKKYNDNVVGKRDSGSMAQVCGRIFRKAHVERNPMIIDLQDTFSVFNMQSRTRDAFYSKQFKNATYTTTRVVL